MATDTIPQMFLNTTQAYVKNDLLAAKKDGRYAPIPTEEFARRVRHLSLGLADLGLTPGEKLVIFSENRPEWTITDFAVLSAGGVTVPIYTSLMPEQVKYIINDSDARIVVVSNRDLWLKVDAVRSELRGVHHFVLIDEEGPQGMMTLSEIMARGKTIGDKDAGLFEQRALAVHPGDLASIIYTSGTTGVPKGVMLSHVNFVSNVRSLTEFIDLRDSDTGLSFLPLSHVLARTATFLLFHVGASMAYAESIEAVASNMVEVRPTIVVSVPRLFEKIYARVMDQVMAGARLKRAIFVWALATGKKYTARSIAGQPIPVHLSFKRAIAQKLVFSKITARTGGRIRYFICGGAPLSRDIMEFFHAMGLKVMPGYGLTETSPVLTGSATGKVRFGTAGTAIPGVELRIAGDGEILARGPNVMMGYYKNEADTREVLKDGWLHTGDIGRFDEDGFLIITDRKKDIIVTSGGKNVAPQPIESLIQASPFIASAVVVGSSRKFISALVVPNFEKVEAWAKGQGLPVSDRAG